MKELYRFVHFFGFSKGVMLFVKFKFSKLKNIHLPEYQSAFSLRPSSTDIAIFRQLFFNRCYDVRLPFDPDTIIDAGANIGLASIFFAHHYPNVRVIVAIEPEAENFRILTANTSALSSIRPVNAALWPSPERLTIEDIGLGESGFFAREDAMGQVPGVTIDQIMSEYGLNTIDILKIDIEGSERQLFDENSKQWLQKTRCLIIETHDEILPGCSAALFKVIHSLNFNLRLSGENLVFLNRDLM